MAEFYTVITTAGREAVARATQAGVKVDITHMAIGDGGGVPVTPSENQTQLVNECWRGLVATYSQQGSKLIIDTYIPPDEASFITREMGLFTVDGVLFAVCNTPEMRKVLPSEGAIDSFVFGMELDITDVDMRYIEIHTNPIFNFDPAGSAEAVQQNLDIHIANKQNPHNTTAAQVGAYTKAQSLTSATAALFGLTTSAVPNDVLAKIKTLIDNSNEQINQRTRIISGTYVGNDGNHVGASPREISLGVYPLAVIIKCAKAIPEPEVDTPIFEGIALRNAPLFRNKYSVNFTAISITQNGFNVDYHLANSDSNIGAATNQSGYSYRYIVFY